MTVSASELAPPPPPLLQLQASVPPPGTKGGGQHSLVGERTGGANSDDLRESLAFVYTLWYLVKES